MLVKASFSLHAVIDCLVIRRMPFVSCHRTLVFVDYPKLTGSAVCSYSVCCLTSITVTDINHVCRLVKMEHIVKSMMQRLLLILCRRGILASRFLFYVSLSGVTGPVVPLFFLRLLDPFYLVYS